MQPLSDRQNDIVSLARASGRVTVEDLAVRFDVTPQTIRRDLNELCDRRVLTRTHGGALISSSVENLSYEARRFDRGRCQTRDRRRGSPADPRQIFALHQYRHHDGRGRDGLEKP